MTAGDGRFWKDVALAVEQVSTNHTRQVVITSDAEGMEAAIGYSTTTDRVLVSIDVTVGKTREVVVKEGE